MALADADRMMALLGITPAPLVREGVTTTLTFFRGVLQRDPFAWVHYIKGIDFHHKVQRIVLGPSTELVRYEPNGPGEKPNRPNPAKNFLYFTKPGTAQQILGTNYSSYTFARYHVTIPSAVLLSRAAGMNFGGRLRPGGGLQYLVPSASMPVETSARAMAAP